MLPLVRVERKSPEAQVFAPECLEPQRPANLVQEPVPVQAAEVGN